MKTLTVVLFFSLISMSAFAQYTGGGGSSSSSGPSSFKLRFLGGLKYQYATFGSKDGTVEDRTLNGVGLDAIAGFSYGSLLVGAGGEYTKLWQMTDPGEVGDTNLSGTMTRISAALGYAAGKFLLLGRYYMSATYTLDKKTEAGDKVEYSKPESAFSLSLLYRPGGASFWSLDYSKTSFGEGSVDGESGTLESGAVMNFSSFGLSYGYMF